MRSLLLCIVLTLSARAADWTAGFEFETIPPPPGVDLQVGGMDFFPDGRLAVAFHRGEVMIYTPATKTWSLFAAGLHEPLGLMVDKSGDVLVMQRPELTRLHDADGDGRADRYETLCDGFGMTGNYHEFAFGPVRDAQGNLYIALNLASNGAPVREEVRGEFSPIGKLNRQQMTAAKDWKKISELAGRMYSRVPYRGWIMKLSPDFKHVEPYACGFRSPDGIGFDAAGRLLATDNQGDWRPTSPLYTVEKGGFYGHPASLVWRAGWDGRDPMSVPVSELDTLQTSASGYFPQGELANSPTQPVVAPANALPPALAGQTIIGEMNEPRLVRVLDDVVDGFHQVGLVSFLDGPALGNGNHRLAFSPDGSLYVGKTALSWAGSKGITRVRWKGTPLFTIDGMKAVPGGFTLRFSQPVDPTSLAGLEVRSHTYEYHAAYGAPKLDETKLTIDSATLSPDGLTLSLQCSPLKARYLHRLNCAAIRSSAGGSLLGDQVWYHLVKLPR